MSAAIDSSFDVPAQAGKRVDLHLHSTCSDGRLKPAAVMEAAGEVGLGVAALTDHDTLAGIDEAARAAEDLGLEFVPGIELSTYDGNVSTHILGYFIDVTDQNFAEHLTEAREARARRAREMVDKLNALGLGLTIDQVIAQASVEGLIARPHVARALLEGGWVKSYREAFDCFIAAGRPAYVPTQRLEPAAGIAMIQAAGGVAVLAHPAIAHDEEAIRGLAEAGLDGLETLHPDHDRSTVQRLRRLAGELSLLETGGSDWHGPHNGGHGPLASQPVPYDWYLRLRAAAGVGTGREGEGKKGGGEESGDGEG